MTTDAVLHLPAGTVRRVPAQGVTCVAGLCWATQAGDARDHVLGPGASWTPAPRRVAFAWALTDSILRLEARELRRGFLAGLATSFFRVWGPRKGPSVSLSG